MTSTTDAAARTGADAGRPAAPGRNAPGSPATGSRAAATARTRANLVAAASALFVERGFGAVSVRDIAAAAGVSHPAVKRHFASKDELLDAVVADFEDRTVSDLEERYGPGGDGLRTYAEVARHNAAVAGYIPLFTTLAGEATSTGHPAHEHFRDRHVELRARSSQLFREAVANGELPPRTDALGETIRLAAAWDGLQLISLYLPDRIDIPAMLDRHLDRLRALPSHDGPAAASDPAHSAAPSPATTGAWLSLAQGDDALDDEAGYAPGRATRARIIADASALFASRGFHATSLRDIAAEVGIGKSTLLHHFASKDDLLRAVVAHRDTAIDERVAVDATAAPATLLAELPGQARLNGEREPGLIEVYAVLSAEAATPGHPAHEYFRRRFELAIANFAALFSLTTGADAEAATFDAIWFVALWDGLQLQWLYDPESIDVGDHLEAHLAALMPVAVGG